MTAATEPWRLLALALWSASACGPGCSDKEPSPPGDGWAFAVELTVKSTADCPEWETVEPDPSPAGEEGTMLWAWHAYDDPLYRETGLVNQSMGTGVTIAADGSLWVNGPEPSRVMRLTPEGNLTFISEPTGGDRFTPTVTAAPDGTVFVANERRLYRYGADGVILSDPYLRPLGPRPRIAIGPRGRVYLMNTEANALVATCQGERVEWEMSLAPRRTTEFITVLPDGDLWLSFVNGDRAIRINPAGEVVDQFPRELPEQRDTYIGLQALTPNRLRATWPEDEDRRVQILVDGRPSHTYPWPDEAYTFRTDAAGEIWWFGDAHPGWWCARDAGGERTWRRQPCPAGHTSMIFLEDGSVLAGVDLDLVARAIGRFAPATGDPIYTISFADAAPDIVIYQGSNALTLADNGVVYVRAVDQWNNMIVAIQTDARPPTAASCYTWGCNARHDFWIH